MPFFAARRGPYNLPHGDVSHRTGVEPGRSCGKPARGYCTACARIQRFLSRPSARSFESAPVGGPAGQSNYFNGAATLATSLPAETLLERLLAVESKLGRVRGERFGPRTIDLDLLLYGEQVIESATLQVPHPRLSERRFVLAPAAEIAGPMRVPTIANPKGSVSIATLADRLPPPAPGELGLRVITSTVRIERHVREVQRSGRRVGLVPTMGALHAGHSEPGPRGATNGRITSWRRSSSIRPNSDRTRTSPNIRARSTPTCRRSRSRLPRGVCSRRRGNVSARRDDDGRAPGRRKPLEGVCRPGHFRGVATIVLKLFHLVPADVAYFGQKDFQQALVIRRMVGDLNVPIEFVVCPTVREADGLAMSSRNRYLSPAERQQALALSRALRQAEQSIQRAKPRAAESSRRCGNATPRPGSQHRLRGPGRSGHAGRSSTRRRANCGAHRLPSRNYAADRQPPARPDITGPSRDHRVRSVLFYIPAELAGYPVFGVGWLLGVWLAVSLAILGW